jgi:hypothetical protein
MFGQYKESSNQGRKLNSYKYAHYKGQLIDCMKIVNGGRYERCKETAGGLTREVG